MNKAVDALLPLVSALADVQGRADAVARLARHVGASALHVFVPDVELRVPLAAPGLPQRVPDHPSWDALLEVCRKPGVHRGDVLDEASGALSPATAYVGDDGTALVFVGGPLMTFAHDELALPLLGALFRAEQRAAAALGEAEASKEASRHAAALTAALDHSRADLERAVQAKQELLREYEMLLGVVVHDLRNPLNSIVMGTAMLLDHADLPPKHLKILSRVRSSSQRMQRMIADLLDFERSRRGSLPIARTRLSLRETLAHVVEELEVANPNRVLTLSADGNGEGEWDGDRFAQLASNLIGNAIQHSSPTSPVLVSLTETTDTLTLEVTNEHSAPIAAEDVSRIFEPFRRGKQSSGLGLGLYIVRQIAQAHGGSVTVRSECGRTTFSIVVPRRAPE